VSVYVVSINITGPDGTVAANLQYDDRIEGFREIVETAIADLLNASGMPDDDDRGAGGDEFSTAPATPPAGPYFEIDTNLAQLREGLLGADPGKKHIWQRMIDEALDKRLKIMKSQDDIKTSGSQEASK